MANYLMINYKKLPKNPLEPTLTNYIPNLLCCGIDNINVN